MNLVSSFDTLRTPLRLLTMDLGLIRSKGSAERAQLAVAGELGLRDSGIAADPVQPPGHRVRLGPDRVVGEAVQPYLARPPVGVVLDPGGVCAAQIDWARAPGLAA